MGVQAELADVVGDLYSSVLEDSKWEEAIEGLVRLVGGNSAFHLVADPVAAAVVETNAFGAPAELVHQFQAHYAAKDVRMAAAMDRSVGELVLDYHLIDLRALRKSEIFNELLVPFDVPYLMALWLKKSPNAFVAFSVEASLKHGPFENESIECFREIIPHLIRVSQARELLQRARLSQHFYRQALDRLPFGMLMLDERGTVIEITRLAEEVLREGVALQYQRRCIRALNAEDDRKLQTAIGSIGRLGRHGGAGQTLTLRRITHSLPLTVLVLPVMIPELLMISPRPACLLLLLDPEHKVRAKVELIQRSLMLTRAESTLALTLFQGLSLQNAAQYLGRSYNTCKTQMKSIYAKTACDSQMDLMKKMMLLAFAPLGGRAEAD